MRCDPVQILQNNTTTKKLKSNTQTSTLHTRYSQPVYNIIRLWLSFKYMTLAEAHLIVYK